MKTAIEIANEYFESISGYELSDKDLFFSKLDFFDKLNYSAINLYYADAYPIEKYKNVKDLTPDADKKFKIVCNFLTLVLRYLHEKTDYKDRQKIQSIILKATRKANDVINDAIMELKELKKSEEYFKLIDKDTMVLSNQITTLLDNAFNEKLPMPNKKAIKNFIGRLKNKSIAGSARSAKSLIDSIN